MANSFIDPSLVKMALEPAAPPWNWNPGATFVEAFNASQENRRRNEEMAMEQELSRILFPAKAAEAAYNMKKFEYDSKLLEQIYKTKSAALDRSYRGITSAIGGSTGNGGGGGNAGTANQSGGYQSRFGFGSKLPSQSVPATRKVGSGLMPKQP